MTNSKLIFLGTAGDVFVMSNQLLNTGGIFFEYNNTNLIINPGPGTLVYMKHHSINPRNLTAILLSNSSILTSSDTLPLISAMTYEGIDPKGILIQNKDNFILDKSYAEKMMFISPFEGLTKLAISDIEINATPCYGSNDIGFRFVTPNFSLVYTGNTFYHNNLKKFYKNSDFLVIPMPKYELVEDSKKEIVKIIDNIQPKLAIITSFNIKMIKRDILNDIRDIQKSTGVQTIAAKDQFSLNIDAYL